MLYTLYSKWYNKCVVKGITQYRKGGYNMRICTECGEKDFMTGYVVDAGAEYYCSDECLHKHYTEQEWEDMYQDAGDTYYTEWWDEVE